MSFYIYILFSSSLNRYYIGSTNDVEERFKKHLSSNKGFTSKAKDWEVKYTESFETRSEAVQREMQIKKWKSRIMIEKLFKA
ncbi:GIY-YIG nuclease family protein [Dokdonia sp. Asnod3-C12]|jgi:putative endonuclease|uniref:GIY-YIG nuclease family protein n=1 Tax=Dokdonia sp. Asnod3-C12 TaxID=3160575 RepID=UPI00386D8C08